MMSDIQQAKDYFIQEMNEIDAVALKDFSEPEKKAFPSLYEEALKLINGEVEYNEFDTPMIHIRAQLFGMDNEDAALQLAKDIELYAEKFLKLASVCGGYRTILFTKLNNEDVQAPMALAEQFKNLVLVKLSELQLL